MATQTSEVRLTADSLFRYARSFARRSEAADRGTKFPTFRQAARRFKVRLAEVEDACNDYVGAGYMKPAVGVRSGSGVAVFESMGDWLVEAYD